MSGIVGIVNLDGAPVDPTLLDRMTRFLAPRGPDAQRTWIDRNAGFGHALLITDPGLARRPQPCTLNGRVWITADARLDARDELLDKLRGRVSADITVASDAELILHAYETWDDACLDHLFGEFVFAIWDSERRRLFCAHDQLGTRLLYFAHVREQVIFSNTLDCVRQHPAVSAKINDDAIGDFLLFGLNHNPETTSFADIRRLPPGHFAMWESGHHVQRRYWQVPIEEPLFYRRRQDYVDQFQSLLRTAVKERLPAGKVGVWMSGGLDSPLLAATAQSLKVESGRPGEVFASTSVYDHLIPDQERYFSGLIARHLGIPHHISVMDGPESKESWFKIPAPSAEPVYSPSMANELRDCFGNFTNLGRVFFFGEGPDNALDYEWNPYLRYLLRGRRWGRLLKDVISHIWLHRRIPLLPTLPRMAREARTTDAWESQFPQWLNPELSARLHLEQRWREIQTPASSRHLVRPRGYKSFDNPLWQRTFENCDSAFGQFPWEFRHPYLNLRLLRFMLQLPALPWCRVKYILRVAARGLLPEEILRRPKAPLARFPDVEMTKRQGLPPLLRSILLEDYLLPDKVSYNPQESAVLLEAHLWAVSLSHWLRDLEALSRSRVEEDTHDGQQRTAT